MSDTHEDIKDLLAARGSLDHQQVYQACKMIGNRIEKFSGTGDRTFEEFLEEYTDLIARFSIPHDVARRLLPLYLSGGAKLKYQTIDNHDQLPWNDLVTQLAKKLKSEALLSNLRDELHNMTQGKDSVGEFAKKVYSKTKIAFQGQGDGIITRMATDFFVKGLNPEIRKAIRRLPETDEFDAIVCRAEKEFRILEQERKEDREAVQAINALISDEKINRLEQQLNRMKVNRRRPSTPMPSRQRNRPQINNNNRPMMGNSFNSQPSSILRRPNSNPRPKKNVTWYNPFREYRANKARLAAQQYQSCNCPTHCCQQNMTYPQPSAPHYVPPYQQPSTSSMMPTTTANLLCLVTFLTLIASAVAQYQVCGTNLYGNTFSLPDVIDCTASPGTAMLRTTIQLYTEQPRPIVLNATKCYKDVLEVSISNFLYIRTQRTIHNRRRVSIPQGLCQTARVTGKVHGHNLTQVLPGLQSTNEIEEENTTLPLWGTNKYTRSIYSIETGQVASFDGKSVTSSLANLENCTLSDGVCIRRDGIVVWEPVHSAPLCRFAPAGSFEALVTMQYIVLPHSDVVLQFSSDYLLHAQLTEQCKTLGNSYLTTSNHIVTFPYIPQDIMIQDYILRMTQRRRVKRGTRILTDKNGRTSRFYLIPPEPVPLIKRLFDTDETNQIPNFRTQPIVKRRMLQDMARWNVTNEDFIRRRRFYNITDPRLIALRTIRYAEYRTKQLHLFRKFEEKRPLNYAEKVIRRDLEHGIAPIFDEYLDAEFGRAIFNIPGKLPTDWRQQVPFFEKSVTPTTTSSHATPTLTTVTITSPTTTMTTTTISPTSQITTVSTTTVRPPPTTLSSPRRVWTILSPRREPHTIPPIPRWMTTIPTRTTARWTTSVTTTQRRTTTRSPTIATPTKTSVTTTPFPLSTATTTSSSIMSTTTFFTLPTDPTTTRRTTTPPSTTRWLETITTSSTRKSTQPYRPMIWPPPLPWTTAELLTESTRTTRPKRVVTTTTETTTNDFSIVTPLPTLPPRTEIIPSHDFGTRRHFNAICARNVLNVQRLHTLSAVDPTLTARILLGRNDVAASHIKGELQITKCRQVIPTHVFTNHSVNGTCYTLTPVLLEDDIWFVIPGTQDLTQSSSITSCPYQEIQPLKTAHKLLPPNTILNMNVPPFLFEAPPIFYRPLQYSATSIRLQIEAIQQQQDDIISRLQKRGIVADAASRIRSTGLSMSRSIRSFYNSITRKLADGVNAIRWSLVNIVLWGSIPAIIITILVVTCVFYVKYRLLRHVSSTAASTVQSAVRTFVSRKNDRRRSRSVNVLLTDLDPQSEREERLFIPRVYAVHHKNSGLPYLKVTLGDHSVTALLDSGASISYMRSSTLASLTTRPTIIPQHLVASTANGSMLQLQGSTTLPVQIGTHTILHQFHIAADKDCPAPLLLGSDFIRNLNEAGLMIAMDLHNQIISVGSDKLNLVQLNHITLTPTNTYGVRINGDIKLPRRTNNIVPAKIEDLPQPRCSTFLIEDNLRPMDDIYVVGRALVSPQADGTCFINILNPSSTDIHLPNRMNVAHAYPACASEIQVNAIQVTVPSIIESPMIHASNSLAAICSIPTQCPRRTAYIPPEADWENHLPHLPMVNPTFDIATEVDLSKAALTDEQKERLRDIIRYHHNAFVGPDGHLGHYRGHIRHRIDLIDNAPIPARKIYRVPLEKRQEIEKQITQMLSEGIIRESSSPFCAPIVLVKKREANTWRFTIDFRGLNAITKPQQSILPNIQDIIDLCANQCLYSSLDFQQGFHQIPLEESHCERTAFACFLGAFEYIRMPMGLKGAPATFQRIMDDFKKYLRARVFIYVDDLIITSETPDDHLIDIDEVLGKIELIGMKLKATKCEFAKEEITFLGFVLSKDGIRPNPEKTRAIEYYPTPQNATDVKSFLGMCSFFRRFINNFANIAAPLTALTKKDTPFLWTPECEEASRKLKRALTSAPILAAPRLGKPFIIETDSSSKGVAGILKQEQDDAVRVIAYASRTLNKHKARYPAIELEALGLVYAVQKFRPYIDGAKCTVITDHAPLKALLHRQDLTGRLAKYQIVLQEFDIQIIYRPGKKNIVCDTLPQHLRRTNTTAHQRRITATRTTANPANKSVKTLRCRIEGKY
ncbi:hypothetical protein Y032_0067g95 [Ancylostoma ceylanicum]|uniref:RNA-directed DNA polymerase n=1 Tax=Ancylostoma ceylanicum TaxID=53326 RepID=A0A016TYZ2_9BILA|nr:hypothetical protein Y032_0067g95 [Ancylostoma ceylanicum]